MYIILIDTGIKKVSHPKEKPQKPRNYAILGALFSIQTPNFLLALWCLKPYFPFISVHLCTVLTVVPIFPQNFIVILLSRAYFSFLIFRLDLHLFILIFTFFNTQISSMQSFNIFAFYIFQHINLKNRQKIFSCRFIAFLFFSISSSKTF